jgi:alanyl-tRNA synthetase
MRSHTATHIILGAARKVLGKHAWQAGVAKGVIQNRLDLSHYSRITKTEIYEIESLANQIVRKSLPVICKWMQRDKAEKEYGFRLYQGGAIPGKDIRIVEIGNWDVEACGGTHLGNTSEAGLIKILGSERVQDGIERIIYAIGPYALKEMQRREALLMDTAELVDSPWEELQKNVYNLLQDLDELKNQLNSIKEIMSVKLAKDLLEEADLIDGLRLVFYADEVDLGLIIEVGNALEKLEPAIVAVMLSNKENRTVVKVGREAINKGIHAEKVVKELAKAIGGSGGGVSYFAQGGGGDPEKFKNSKEALRVFVKKQLLELHD